MSIEGQGHSLTLVKCHSDFKVQCLTFGLYTQVSDSGPLGPLVIAWHVATACLYFRQVHRLAIAITKTVSKMDCDELIDEMLSCSGGTAEKQRYEGPAGDSLASPDACS